MGLLWSLFVGLIVGGVAKLVMPGRDPGGVIITMLLGIIGSVVAGIIGRALGWYDAGQAPGVIASVFGAVLVLVVYRLALGRRNPV